MAETAKQIFEQVDKNNDGIIFIEELEKAPIDIKKKIAEEFEKKYTDENGKGIKFGKEHGIDFNEFNDFMGTKSESKKSLKNINKKELDIFYNRDERWYQASQEKSKYFVPDNEREAQENYQKSTINLSDKKGPKGYNKASGHGGLFDTVDKMTFDENLRIYPITNERFFNDINDLIKKINTESQKNGGGSGLSSIGKYGKVEVGSYIQNGEEGIIEIEYFGDDKKLLLNGYLVSNFGWDGLNMKTLNEAINNIGKEIEFNTVTTKEEEAERRRLELQRKIMYSTSQ